MWTLGKFAELRDRPAWESLKADITNETYRLSHFPLIETR